MLGVAPDVTDQDLRKAWRTLLAEAHPDRAAGRGLPADFIAVAETKAAAINAAYDAATRERRAYAEAGVA